MKHSLKYGPQPVSEYPARETPVIIHQARSIAGCRESSPPPALTMQPDHIFQKRSVNSGNPLQAPSPGQEIWPPKLSEQSRWRVGKNCGCPELIVFCSFAIPVAFLFLFFYFSSNLKSDRFCRLFCPRSWAPSKALFLKHGLFTLPAPGTSSVSKFPVLTEVDFHFCKSQAATCFWEVNKPPEKCWWLVFHCFINIFIQWHHSILNKSLKRKTIKKTMIIIIWILFIFVGGNKFIETRRDPSIVFDSL